MIYLTGDIHGNPIRFSKDAFPEQKNMTKDDFVIILGDFGIIWDEKDTRNEKYWIDWLDNKPFTTLFIDGNHENFNRLYTFPVVDFHGGKARQVGKSVYHLCRGEIFNLNGKTFFTFGGARSHDITDGILDRKDKNFKFKKKNLDKNPFALYRILNESWWELELPTDEELEHAKKNLENVSHVDYVLTHTPPHFVYDELGFKENRNQLTIFLDELYNNLDFNIWFCGHMHENMKVNNKLVMLYEQIVELK